MSKLEKALEAYEERFGENFPLLCLRGVSDDDIIRLAEESIKTNEPYETQEDGDY